MQHLPLLKSIPFGLQHVPAMFVANIAPIMIVSACVVTAIGFSLLSITIAALSLSIGLGFTQIPDMFNNFPGYHPYDIRRKLRCGCLPYRNYHESDFAQKHGSLG